MGNNHCFLGFFFLGYATFFYSTTKKKKSNKSSDGRSVRKRHGKCVYYNLLEDNIPSKATTFLTKATRSAQRLSSLQVPMSVLVS